MKKDHAGLKGICWNKTCGRVVGEFRQTPLQQHWKDADCPPGISNSFPQRMGEVMKTGREWVDLTSLSPPDGLFLEAIKDAIATLAASGGGGDPIVVRLLFGNIVGMPVDTDALTE